MSDVKNITAERIVIGTLLNHPEWVVELNGIIKTEFFYMKVNKLIFYIIVSLLKEGVENIDTFSIMAKAEKIVKAEDVINESGGFEYIEEIKYISEDYSKDDLFYYSKDVATASYKRDILRLNSQYNEYVTSDMDLTVEEVRMWYQKQQTELDSKYSSGQKTGIMEEVFDEVWLDIEMSRSDSGIVGLPSKIPLINEYFTYQQSELIVIGARAKYGKSMFAMNEAHYLAVQNDIPVGILDTEMKTRTFITRLTALDSGIPVKSIQRGDYLKHSDLVDRVEESKNKIRKAPLVHEYSTNWTQERVSQKAKLLKLKYDMQLFVYDYIKIKEINAGIKEHQFLGNWTIFLKDLAGELDIPILTFAQLSPYEKRVADSDKINRYASVVGYLLQKEGQEIARDFGAEEGGTDYLLIDYNRLGESHRDETKGINLIYQRHLASFEQAPYQVLQDEYQ